MSKQVREVLVKLLGVTIDEKHKKELLKYKKEDIDFAQSELRDIIKSTITPKQLHSWYLEAITYLDGRDFNPNADTPYEDLTKGQKSIDEYIANKIAELFNLEKEVK